jgi:MFS family permease
VPVLLVLLRLIQGFAVAGEISGASSMILEHAPFGRRGFYASCTLHGVQAGQIIAAAVFLPLAAYMPEEALNIWVGGSRFSSACSSSSRATSFAAGSTKLPPLQKKANLASAPGHRSSRS